MLWGLKDLCFYYCNGRWFKGIGDINKNIMAYNIIEIVGASQNMEFALYAWGSSFRTLNSRNLIGTDLWKGPNTLLSSSYINVNKSYLHVHCFHREVPFGACLCCVIHKGCSLGLLQFKVSQPLLHTPIHRVAQDLRAFLRFEECGANTARRWRRQGKAVRWCWAGQRVESVSSVKVAAVALLEDRSLRSRTRTHRPQAGKDFPGEVHERGAGLINKLTCSRWRTGWTTWVSSDSKSWQG